MILARALSGHDILSKEWIPFSEIPTFQKVERYQDDSARTDAFLHVSNLRYSIKIDNT